MNNVSRSDRPHEIVRALVEAFEGARDEVRAEPMTAYMRGQFEFLGIPPSERVALTHAILRRLATPGEVDLVEALRALWTMPQREYQYAAIGPWRGTTRSALGPNLSRSAGS